MKQRERGGASHSREAVGARRSREAEAPHQHPRNPRPAFSRWAAPAGHRLREGDARQVTAGHAQQRTLEAPGPGRLEAEGALKGCERHRDLHRGLPKNPADMARRTLPLLAANARTKSTALRCLQCTADRPAGWLHPEAAQGQQSCAGRAGRPAVLSRASLNYSYILGHIQFPGQSPWGVSEPPLVPDRMFLAAAERIAACPCVRPNGRPVQIPRSSTGIGLPLKSWQQTSRGSWGLLHHLLLER